MHNERYYPVHEFRIQIIKNDILITLGYMACMVKCNSKTNF